LSAVRDLSDTSGLALWLVSSTGELALGAAVVSDPPYARTLDDLRPVLADDGVQGAKLPYRIYRDVRSRGDEAVLRESSLRYDVTVTLPGALGEEFVKTAGHYHTRSPAGPTYPEVYEVLNGRAAFVLQRVDDPEGSEPEVQEVWVAVCVAGEKIVYPPTAATPRSTSGRSPWRSLTWYRVVPRTTTALSGRPEEEPTT
jgi:glucose-6-phosphate isomerase, archaeal